MPASMEERKDHLFLLLIACLAIAAKFVFAETTTDHLRFILYPTVKAIEVLSGLHFTYSPEVGYIHSSLNIVINKSCSGTNFLVIVFLTSSFVLFQKISGNAVWLLIISIIISYFTTILANTSRIIISICLLSNGSSFPWLSSHWFHQAEGAFVYLFTLITIILILNSLASKRITNNEKPA